MASWDFAYGGHLAEGDTLKRRQLAPILSDGRAWGAAVAAYHANESMRGYYAATAMLDSMLDDYNAQVERGFRPTPEQCVMQQLRLSKVLEHYIEKTLPLPNLTRLEGEINVPIWSRGKGGKSNLYRFQCFIDGWMIDGNRNQWIIEFKLRSALYEAEQILLSRQPRWYSWGLREVLRGMGQKENIVGLYMEERLNEYPKPPNWKNGVKEHKGMRVPSEDKRQITTPELYIAACEEAGIRPAQELVSHLAQRRWQHRVPIIFRKGELDEAGAELVSAAKLIRDLDSGEFMPIRNAKPANCRSCEFRPICAEPKDTHYVNTLFARTVPKRLRSPEEEAA